TGVGIYTSRLVSAMAEMEGVEEIVLFANGDIPSFAVPNVRTVRYRSRVQHLAIQLELPKLLAENRIDILHGPNFYLPVRGKTPMAVTIHDLSAQFFPGQHSLKHRLSQKFLRPSMKKADRIIAVSEFTSREIARYCPKAEDKIRVVHNGVGENFVPTDEKTKSEIKSRHGLPERFALFVGTLEPRKNVGRLVEAFGKATNIEDLKLVIAGGKGWLYGEIFESVKKLGLEDRVIFPGYIPSEDLPALYSSAEFFCYPSLYEGFGLPVLESMACGTPVLTSRDSSMSEVAGEAALLADPMDIDSIAEGILKLASDETLRKNLAEKGLSRAKKFSWKSCATKTLDIYREIM
ncbi:MAG: glycosyltransferase family 4 protein, partial [bacterium]